MKRSVFLKTLIAAAPLAYINIKLNAMNHFMESLENTAKMPALFVGHGSPMNAIEENAFVQGFRNSVQGTPIPKAIVVISAHWETIGTKVTAMDNPPTIHDFGGFPKELFQVQYPAPGSPLLAGEMQRLLPENDVQKDFQWGLDHGAWTILRHMYPKANVPVIQLSIDYRKTPAEHYALAQALYKLRTKGVLIIGSGNLVHNLGLVDWRHLNENYAYDWALEASQKMNTFILKADHQSLINFSKQGKAFDLAIPTSEHFLPLLYILALQDKTDHVSLFNDQALGGSLYMTSVKLS